MSAPPTSAQAAAIELDPQDLVAEPEERSTSQTRRLGSNAQAVLEFEVRQREAGASLPDPPAPSDDPPTVRHLNAGDVVPVAPAEPGKPFSMGPQAAPTPAPPSGAPTPKPYLAGDVIDGKYRLTRIIGRGGMGAVWAAHNIPLDIDVAIKLIRRDRTAPGAADRLLTEARAAARLMHPAIVRVFDFGETDQGDPFIVMELLRGESLAAILRRKHRLSPTVAVQALLPVAGALSSAHQKGIVHRDLKPDNIIVITDENGALVPKIVDFGIAKLLQPDVDRQVTLAGEVLGSPDYMSPEQARGAENVGEATDIWAFSVVLYELVTGKRPFDGPNYNALIASILTDDPRPITDHGAGDNALAGIVAHGLQKEITARWPRMRDMGAALASWAIANGVEDDLTGNPIAKQWLSGGARRLLTVQPETGEPPIRSSMNEAASPWASRPPPPSEARAVPAAAERRASARRAALLVVGIVILGALAVAGFLARERLTALAAGAPSTSASTDTAPTASASASATAAASSSAADPASSASAPPAGSADAPSVAPSASVKPGPLKPRGKGKAPPAPRTIKF
jgi:serine/threonine-protein kinase